MKHIPAKSPEEEQYIDKVLEGALKLVAMSKDAPTEEMYITIEVNSAVYLIERYRRFDSGNNAEAMLN